MTSRKMEAEIKIKYISKLKQQQRNFKIAEEMNGGYLRNSENRGKNRDNEDSQMCGDFKQKVMTKMRRQLNLRKEINHNIQNKLSKLITETKEVHLAFKQNVKGIKVNVAISLDALKKATCALKQRIHTLQGMHQHFKKQCDAKDTEHQDQVAQLETDLYEEIIKIKKEVLSQTKKSNFKMMLRILRAIQDNNS